MIRIQPYQPQYRDGVRDLIVPIQREEFGVAITYDDQPDLKDIPGFYQKDAGGFWIASDAEGSVVGSIALLDIGESGAALRKMFVTADYRGHPHRVAQRLLETLIDHAAQQKLQNIYLGTTDKYLAAHRFYEKNGFGRIDAENLPAAFPRMAVDSIFYRYQIQDRNYPCM